MGVIDCVKKGFSVAKGNSGLILLLFAFSFAWNLINIPFQNETTDIPSLSMIVLGILFILTNIFMQAGTLGFLAEAIKTGRVNLAAFKGFATKNFVKILCIGFVVALIVIIMAVSILIMIQVGGGTFTPITMILGFVLLMMGMISAFLLLLAPYSAVVDEGSNVLSAIQKSIRIVKAKFLPIIGMLAVLILIGFAIGFVIGIILGLLAGVLGAFSQDVVKAFLSSAVNAYMGVVTTAALMTFYLSLSSEQAEEPTVS